MKLVLVALTALVMSCSSTPPQAPAPVARPESVGIYVATHPKVVEKLEFYHGWSTAWHIADPYEMGEAIAYLLMEEGYANLVVFCELLVDREVKVPGKPVPGGGIMQMYADQARAMNMARQVQNRYLWQVSLYKAADG